MPSPVAVLTGLSLALTLLAAVLAWLLWRIEGRQRALAADLTRLEEERARDRVRQGQLEARLTQPQKLAAIGQLAAGIAHEINTPIQYIGDNLRFLQEGFDDLDLLLTARRSREPALEEEMIRLEDEVDLDYLKREIPNALSQSLEGVTRVTEIVQAMKQFSHPGSSDKTPLDLNATLLGTLSISRHEWKYVAEAVTDLDPDLPRVPALAGEIGQVLLNLVLNAVHAIEAARRQGREGTGTLTLTTRREGDWARIDITDTGTGIPAPIRERVFEPFFTTKEPGKGTGQGLSLARTLVVEHHGGTLTFDSQEGVGTTFTIRLPLTAPE